MFHSVETPGWQQASSIRLVYWPMAGQSCVDVGGTLLLADVDGTLLMNHWLCQRFFKKCNRD